MQEHPCACTRRLPVHSIQLSKNRDETACGIAHRTNDPQAHFPKDPITGSLGEPAIVELMGIEPTTPGLQSRCSPS